MYSAPLTAELCHQFLKRDGYGNSTPQGNVVRLSGLSNVSLLRVNEEQNEFGGYFIVNGIERCVRLLQVPRANHAMNIQRSNYKNRGKLYTDLGVAVRCQRFNGDMSTITSESKIDECLGCWF
jgi:DNA-directed RNA polymerase beta subunit